MVARDLLKKIPLIWWYCVFSNVSETMQDDKFVPYGIACDTN